MESCALYVTTWAPVVWMFRVLINMWRVTLTFGNILLGKVTSGLSSQIYGPALQGETAWGLVLNQIWPGSRVRFSMLITKLLFLKHCWLQDASFVTCQPWQTGHLLIEKMTSLWAWEAWGLESRYWWSKQKWTKEAHLLPTFCKASLAMERLHWQLSLGSSPVSWKRDQLGFYWRRVKGSSKQGP